MKLTLWRDPDWNSARLYMLTLQAASWSRELFGWKEMNVTTNFWLPSSILHRCLGFTISSVWVEVLKSPNKCRGSALGHLCSVLSSINKDASDKFNLSTLNMTISLNNRIIRCLILISPFSSDPVWPRQRCSSRALAQTTSGRSDRKMTDGVYFMHDHILTAGLSSTAPGRATLSIISNTGVPTAVKPKTPAGSNPETRGR